MNRIVSTRVCIALVLMVSSAASDAVQSPSDVPAFGAGTYELLTVRDAPLLDDSLAAERTVAQVTDWAGLDRARTAVDSTTFVQGLIRRCPACDAAYDLAHARSRNDSAKVTADYFAEVHCVEWLVKGTLQLESNGHFTTSNSIRQYCRGDRPAYSRRIFTFRDSLDACDKTGPPVQSNVLHVTCTRGRYQQHWLSYRHVGDTLVLGQPCDGRDLYLLQNLAPHPQLTAARFRDLSGC